MTDTNYLPDVPASAFARSTERSARDARATHRPEECAGQFPRTVWVQLGDHFLRSAGNSQYHGLAVDVSKRLSGHLTFKGAYTWSHLMDDSTMELNFTSLTPRRPQDFLNLRPSGLLPRSTGGIGSR